MGFLAPADIHQNLSFFIFHLESNQFSGNIIYSMFFAREEGTSLEQYQESSLCFVSVTTKESNPF